MTSGMITGISENIFQSQGQGIFSVTLHSEIWGEYEKPGRIIDTQAFIEDDHPDLPNTCYVSGFVSRSLPELRVTVSVIFC